MSASSLSSLVPPPVITDWTKLPLELTSSILLRLGAVEILENAQKACTQWRRISKDPSMWRRIDMRELGNRGTGDLDFDILCRHAVDRSQGGLLEINLGVFATDELITYIADRSRNLRSLGLRMFYTCVTKEKFGNAIAKLPFLETFEVSHSGIRLDLKSIGYACPLLKTLKLNSSGLSAYIPSIIKCDDDDYALAIAETMPQLHHLQLLGDRITDNGLKAILVGCPQLEHLDLRKCFNINLAGNLEKQCSEKKDFRRPDDSTADYPYDLTIFKYDSYSDDDDYYNVDFLDDTEVYYDD
ncbi:hypothetical protein CARUB_v10021798mg [Capsella rubella]|uniref:F-box domain-containing protein n=1 Tax=Capsella rubella TaxID=81985 RepID=R0GEN8_9BRAS|nr:putative F-box protein At4g05475 [Capsella rubella]EOA34277.1 hypothetical protein CARUB_v10021798mg [Capsella rubella]